MVSTTDRNQNLNQHLFGAALGQVVWLMTMSDDHKDLPIREIESRVSTPLFLKQFKLYSKGNQPVAFVAWAMVTDEVKARLDEGECALDFNDWRAGPNLVVVECVSPFASREEIKAQFFAKASSSKQQSSNA